MLWTFKQNSFAGGRLDKELMGRQDLEKYFKGTTELENFVVRRQGLVSKRRGTTYVAGVTISNDRFRLIPIVYSRDEGYYLLLTDDKITLYSRSGKLSEITGTGIKSTITKEGATKDYPNFFDELDYFQSGDTIYVVHKAITPKRITFWHDAVEAGKSWDGKAHAAKTVSVNDINFSVASVRKPTEISASRDSRWQFTTDKDGDAYKNTKTVYYTATYVTKDGVESLPCKEVPLQIYLPWPNTAKVTVTVTLRKKGETDSYEDLDYVNIYKRTTTEFGLIGKVTSDKVIDKTTTGAKVTFEDDLITPSLAITPPKDKEFFNKDGEYPSVVAVYQQRLVLGATSNEPFKFWMSCIGDLYNFNTHDSIREDDAISATLAATEMPEINHAVHTKELMLFTNSGEWEVAPVSGNTLSYKTVSAKMQSAIGCAGWTKPIVIGDEIIFVDASGQMVYATRYNYVSDGYESQDLTVLSQDIFKNHTIKRMAYKRHPDSEIICVMDDGSIATLAYMKEHDVFAWSVQKLGGGWKAVDVACPKSLHGGSSETMILVKSGSSYELWVVNDDSPYRSGTSTPDEFVCLDRCCSIASGTSVPTGSVAVDSTTGAIVSAGTKMPHAGKRGYAITSKLRTVYPEMQGGNDTIQMEIKNATEARIRTIETSTFTVKAVGTSAATTVSSIPTASSGKLVLGDVDARVNLAGINTKDGRIEITHSQPYPINILSLATTYQVETANLNGGGNG